MNCGKVGITAHMCGLLLLTHCDGGFGIYETRPDAALPDLAKPHDLRETNPDLYTPPSIYAFEEILLSNKLSAEFIPCSSKNITSELQRDTLTITFNQAVNCLTSDGGTSDMAKVDLSVTDGGVIHEDCIIRYEASLGPHPFDKMYTLNGNVTVNELKSVDTINARVEAWTGDSPVCGKAINDLSGGPFSSQCFSDKGKERDNHTDRVGFTISVHRNVCNPRGQWVASSLRLVASSFVPVVSPVTSP